MERDASRDILPIFVVRLGDKIATSFEGTGFLLSPNIFVTCWHCVAAELPEGTAYVVAIRPEHDGSYQFLPLENISQHPDGFDLALGTLNGVSSSFGFTLAASEVDTGTDVWTYGYPLTEKYRLEDQARFRLAGRFLQGYVTRTFCHAQPGFPHTASYELDMPVPAGLSGAPLCRVNSRSVVGAVYPAIDVSMVEHAASIDIETGARDPEIHRIVSFGLAHYTEQLHSLRGQASGGRPLVEVVGATSSA